MLYTLPRPRECDASVVPCAAWLPPTARGAAGQAGSVVQGDVVMPCATLALAWGETVQILQVRRRRESAWLHCRYALRGSGRPDSVPWRRVMIDFLPCCGLPTTGNRQDVGIIASWYTID